MADKVANWIAAGALIIAVPGALLAWSEFSENRDNPPVVDTDTDGDTNSGGGDTDTDTDGDTDSGGTDSSEDTAAGTIGGGKAVEGACVLTVDHIGAQLQEEPDHRSVVLSSVPSGDYTALESARVEWAGLEEQWFQLEVDGRVGWLVYNTIVVTAKSAACP